MISNDQQSTEFTHDFEQYQKKSIRSATRYNRIDTKEWPANETEVFYGLFGGSIRSRVDIFSNGLEDSPLRQCFL